MAFVLHSGLTGDNVGVTHKWTVADATALAALTPVSADIGRYAYQQDTREMWLLVNNVGPVWIPSGRRGFSSVRTETGDFSFALADAGGKVYVDKATAVAATVELNATVEFDGFDAITVIQVGAGAVTITPVSGAVTLIAPASKSLVTNGAGAVVGLTPVPGTLDTWNVYGDLA